MLPGLSSLALAKATSRPTALCFCFNFSIANLMLLVVNDRIKLKLCSLVFDIFVLRLIIIQVSVTLLAKTMSCNFRHMVL